MNKNDLFIDFQDSKLTPKYDINIETPDNAVQLQFDEFADPFDLTFDEREELEAELDSLGYDPTTPGFDEADETKVDSDVAFSRHLDPQEEQEDEAEQITFEFDQD